VVAAKLLFTFYYGGVDMYVNLAAKKASQKIAIGVKSFRPPLIHDYFNRLRTIFNRNGHGLENCAAE